MACGTDDKAQLRRLWLIGQPKYHANTEKLAAYAAACFKPLETATASQRRRCPRETWPQYVAYQAPSYMHTVVLYAPMYVCMYFVCTYIRIWSKVAPSSCSSLALLHSEQDFPLGGIINCRQSTTTCHPCFPTLCLYCVCLYRVQYACLFCLHAWVSWAAFCGCQSWLVRAREHTGGPDPNSSLLCILLGRLGSFFTAQFGIFAWIPAVSGLARWARLRG